jgi:hypothetical protein
MAAKTNTELHYDGNYCGENEETNRPASIFEESWFCVRSEVTALDRTDTHRVVVVEIKIGELGKGKDRKKKSSPPKIHVCNI